MKSFAQLLSSILPSSHSPFELKILNSSLMQNVAQISMSDILYLIECFEGYGPECDGVYLTGVEYLNQFFKLIHSKPLPSIVTVKLCLTLHLILYEFQVGDLVADGMLNFQIPKPQVVDQNYEFIQNYSIYLMKVAQGLKVFYAAKVGQYPPVEVGEEQALKKAIQDTEVNLETQAQNFNQMRKHNKFSANNVYFQQYQQEKLEKQYSITPGAITTEQKTLFLFKLHNLINTAQQILKSLIEYLRTIIKQVPYTKEMDEQRHLFIEISCVIWNDIMVMYKFSGQEINKLIDIFRSQQLHIILSTQQLYHSMTDITKLLKWTYENKSAFDLQKVVRKPYWFEEHKNITASLNNAVIDLKVHGRVFSPDNRHSGSKINPPKQPFSARNADAGSKTNFFKSTPRSPQGNQTKVPPIMTPPTNPQKKNFFAKFTGGIFDDNSEYMSPRVFEQSSVKETTATSQPKPFSSN